VNGFVLAGGKSSRMGSDKALLELDGHPLIDIALGKVRALGMQPQICGSRPDLTKYAPAIPDNFPDRGPLGGIEAALTVSESEGNLFVPTDLPLLPVEFLAWIASRAEATGAVATIPIFGGRYQPLCGAYSRRLLAGLRFSLASGDFKVMTAITTAAAALQEPIDAFCVESVAAALMPRSWPAELPMQEWFRNLNSPEDYVFLRTMAGHDAAGANRRDPIS